MTEREFRLSEDFLRQYRVAKDPFTSLIARATYLTKYCRNNETWTDTIRRVVEGNIVLDTVASDSAREHEAHELFDTFWTMKALPPGRGLWAGGVPGMPPDSFSNCWGTTLRTIDDWCWTANQLMLGGGVGVGLSRIDELGVVATGAASLRIQCRPDHPNIGEVVADQFLHLHATVADSRSGWVNALRNVLECAYAGNSCCIDVSLIRPRGAPIKTFGGVACGPGPLVNLLRSVWAIVRGAAGRRLTSVECLDITNYIGLCIKSGNVRRSALIVLGDHNDLEFRTAKHDFSAVLAHRHTSNNSLVFYSPAEIASFDWKSLVDDIATYGEPGICNMWRARIDDMYVNVVNPCAEIFLHDREACNLVEVFPGVIGMDSESTTHHMRSVEYAALLATRYCLRQKTRAFDDPEAEEVRARNMKLGIALGGIVDRVPNETDYRSLYCLVKREAYKYADELGVNRPIALTTIKPSGTISLLNGSSPGMHAPISEFYIRRQRIAKNDPLAEELTKAGVLSQDCAYDATGHTLVFEFPVRRIAESYGNQESIDDQFARQTMLQEHWADNAVSATLNYDASEIGDLPGLLRAYVPRLKSTSMLPRAHGYVQAPYETIDSAEYARRASVVDMTASLEGSRGSAGATDDECAAGVCPVR